MTTEENSSYQDYGLLGWDAVWFGSWETNILGKPVVSIVKAEEPLSV
jgi:hypothetical protein